MYRFINKNSIDFIHAHGKGAGVIARITNILSKKILVFTFHGIHYKCHNFFMRKLYIIYENLFGRLDTHKILVSESERKFASIISGGIDSSLIPAR